MSSLSRPKTDLPTSLGFATPALMRSIPLGLSSEGRSASKTRRPDEGWLAGRQGMYLSGPYSSCFSAENRSAAAGSKVIGAHGAPLGRLQLEFRPKLVKPMFREREEDEA